MYRNLKKFFNLSRFEIEELIQTNETYKDLFDDYELICGYVEDINTEPEILKDCLQLKKELEQEIKTNVEAWNIIHLN